MKNSKYIIALAALLITSVANATVRTLNNNNPSPGQYTNWAAVDAASSMNDTVYVSGSPVSYGDITVTKYNLLIMGTGHNPQKQNPLVSRFDNISGNTFVAGIRVDGIVCDHIDVTPSFGTAQLFVNNSLVKRSIGMSSSNTFDCYLYSRNNVIGTGLSLYYNSLIIQAGGALRGEIANCIIQGPINVMNLSGFTGLIDGCNIMNNIFIKHSTTLVNLTYLFAQTLTEYDNSIFNNNIILNYGYHSLNTGTSSVVCENNLFYPSGPASSLPNSSGNIYNSNPLFVNFPCGLWNCPFDTIYDYHLQSASPGHNAGTDGTDIGPYGGSYGATFTTYGEPLIPQMKQMNMPATVMSGNTFNVNIISTVK